MDTDFNQLAVAIETTEDDNIFFNIFNRFIGFHTRQATRETINDTSSEYPFVAMDTRQVFAQIRFVHDYLGITPDTPSGQRPTFLDIGCGIGNVLLIAEQFQFEVAGIEKDDYPFRIAASLLGAERIVQEDIRTYGGYGRFEVIYYFRPFARGEEQCRFETRLEDLLKPGAILIANRKNSAAIETDPRFRKINPDQPIWQKTG